MAGRLKTLCRNIFSEKYIPLLPRPVEICDLLLRDEMRKSCLCIYVIVCRNDFPSVSLTLPFRIELLTSRLFIFLSALCNIVHHNITLQSLFIAPQPQP